MIGLLLAASAVAGHRTGEHRSPMTAAAQGTSGGGNSNGDIGGGGGNDLPDVTTTVSVTTATVPRLRSTTTTTTATSTPTTEAAAPAPTSTGCPSGTGANVQCYEVHVDVDTDTAQVPDGHGGFINVQIDPQPISLVSGTSADQDNDVTYRIEVENDTGRARAVQKGPSAVRQAIAATVAALLLALTGVWAAATVRRRRRAGLA